MISNSLLYYERLTLPADFTETSPQLIVQEDSLCPTARVKLCGMKLKNFLSQISHPGEILADFGQARPGCELARLKQFPWRCFEQKRNKMRFWFADLRRTEREFEMPVLAPGRTALNESS